MGAQLPEVRDLRQVLRDHHDESLAEVGVARLRLRRQGAREEGGGEVARQLQPGAVLEWEHTRA